MAAREVVVAGTYHQVPASPVGRVQCRGRDSEGHGRRGVGDLLRLPRRRRLRGRRAHRRPRPVGQLAGAAVWPDRGIWVIPIVGFAFAWGGILIQMQEELIAFVPVLLLLTRRLGFNALIAVAMSLGAAAVGASFSPINPFQVGIAQKVAGLRLLSGWEFRSVFLAGGAGSSGPRGRCASRAARASPPEAAEPAGTARRRVAADGDSRHRARRPS